MAFKHFWQDYYNIYANLGVIAKLILMEPYPLTLCFPRTFFGYGKKIQRNMNSVFTIY